MWRERLQALGPTGRRRLRVALLVALLGGLAAVGFGTGIVQNASVDSLREAVTGAGFLGVLLFLGAFALGTLVQVPGMLFVVAAALVWGQAVGGAVALVGALLSVTLSFVLVRAVGGRLLAEIDRPLLRRILARLDAHPVRTVAVLRLLFWVSPPLNYALALSSVSRRDYLVGSALGLLVPVALASTFVDALV